MALPLLCSFAVAPSSLGYTANIHPSTGSTPETFSTMSIFGLSIDHPLPLDASAGSAGDRARFSEIEFYLTLFLVSFLCFFAVPGFRLDRIPR